MESRTSVPTGDLCTLTFLELFPCRSRRYSFLSVEILHLAIQLNVIQGASDYFVTNILPNTVHGDLESILVQNLNSVGQFSQAKLVYHSLNKTANSATEATFSRAFLSSNQHGRVLEATKSPKCVEKIKTDFFS